MGDAPMHESATSGPGSLDESAAWLARDELLKTPVEGLWDLSRVRPLYPTSPPVEDALPDADMHLDGIFDAAPGGGRVFHEMCDTPCSPECELRAWWEHQADDEIERTVPKAIEYGSHDLEEIGRQLAWTMGRQEVEPGEFAELGVYFYLLGKMARWSDAIRRGERPSDDTLFDIGVYVRMAQRIRHAGGWPGHTTRGEDTN